MMAEKISSHSQLVPSGTSITAIDIPIQSRISLAERNIHDLSTLYDQKSRIDAKELAMTLARESVAAVIAATSVSPFVAIIDRAIVCNASGVSTFRTSITEGILTMTTRPLTFVRQPYFMIIWGVFAGTYTAANYVDAICKKIEKPSHYPKFFVTSSVNIFLSVRKDALYAQMFGRKGIVPKPMPVHIKGLLGLRDSMTMTASFILPSYIAPHVQQHTNLSHTNSLFLSQLVAPVAIQIASTPINLLGLDLYNRENVSIHDRITFIQKVSDYTICSLVYSILMDTPPYQEYFKTLIARAGRIFPAFGIGGVINTHLRKDLPMFKF